MTRLLIVTLFAALLIALAWPAVPAAPYSYDEADYMYATRLGLSANFTDTPTMPLAEFLRTGLRRGSDKQQSAQLSEQIRGSDDIVFYRHWHGPLYFYWLTLLSNLGAGEHAMRLSMLVFPVGSLLLIFFGVTWFGAAHGLLAAILSSALFAWSVPAVRSSELAPHQAFVLTYLAGLFCLSKTVASGSRRYFYVAIVAAALSCCLLEVGLVMVATVLVCGYAERRNLRVDWGFALRSLLLFAATILVVWPGAIFKLSFVKGYLFMAYLAVFRKGPWGSQGLVETWRQRFLDSPVEWIVIVGSLLAWILSRKLKGDLRVLYPFLVFAALMLAATLRVTTGAPRYSLPFEPALDVLAGCATAAFLARLPRPAAYAATGVLCIALFSATWRNLHQRPEVPADSRLPALLAYVRENHLDRSRLLVPQDDLPTIHYYFPATHLKGYTGPAPELSAAVANGTDGILYPGVPVRYRPVTSR